MRGMLQEGSECLEREVSKFVDGLLSSLAALSVLDS